MKLIKPITLFLILFCLTNNAFAEKGHLTFRPYIELSNYAYQEPSVMEKTSDKPFLGLGLTVEAPILNDLVILDVAYKTGTIKDCCIQPLNPRQDCPQFRQHGIGVDQRVVIGIS